MSWDIVIGKASPKIRWNEPNERGVITPCEGDEPDGLTSPQFTIHKGPERFPGTIQWLNFMDCSQPLADLQTAFCCRSNDGWPRRLNTNFVKDCIDRTEELIPTFSPIDQDRAKWLVYWVREAIRLYGDDAAIGFW